MKDKLKTIRENLYAVNAQIVSLQMIALKDRSDKTVFNLNECLAELLKQLDEIINLQ
jgi:hypothetical protein